MGLRRLGRPFQRLLQVLDKFVFSDSTSSLFLIRPILQNMTLYLAGFEKRACPENQYI